MVVASMTKLEAEQLIKEATAARRNALLEPEAKALLSAYGIDVPISALLKAEDDLGAALKKVSPPYILKVISPDILHKSDIGGVVTGLNNQEEIEKAFKEIKKNISEKSASARIEGFLLEEMAPKGVEVIIGGLRDEQFGPAVMFGIGGIAVELTKDVSYRLAPLDKEEAMSMMKELKSHPLLTGYRGSSAVDLDKLGEAIVKISEMIDEMEGIKEIEINPLIAYKDGVMAVDARVVLKKEVSHA